MSSTFEFVPLAPANLTAFRASAAVLHLIALIMTCFRVGYRQSRGPLYWDDGFAITAAIFDVTFFATIPLKIVQTGRQLQGAQLEGTEAVVSYIVQVVSYMSTVWCGRLSIAFSILRVVPPSPLRRVVIGIIVFFACAWVSLVTARVVACLQLDFAHHGGYCVLGPQFSIPKVLHDALANILLVVIPVHMLWRSRLPPYPRRIIRTIFGLNVFITIFSVVDTVAQFRLSLILDGYMAHYEAAVTLMACNLLVVGTWLYRVLRSGEEPESTTSDKPTTQPPHEPTPLTFTTISSHDPSSSSSGNPDYYEPSRATSNTDVEKCAVVLPSRSTSSVGLSS